MRTHSIYAGFLVHAHGRGADGRALPLPAWALPVSLTPLGSTHVTFSHWTALIWVAWGLALRRAGGQSLALLAAAVGRAPSPSSVTHILGVRPMSTARRPKSWLLCALVLTAAAAGCAKGMTTMTGAAGSGARRAGGNDGDRGQRRRSGHVRRGSPPRRYTFRGTRSSTRRARRSACWASTARAANTCARRRRRVSTCSTAPTGPSTIDGMNDWHINTVRLPLNESCWLGHQRRAA